MFLELDPDRIVATSEKLRDRIRERFPDANLARVADELVAVAAAHAARSRAIRRPSHGLRTAGILALLLAMTSVGVAIYEVHPEVGNRWQLLEIISAVEAAVGTTVFLGAAFVFLWTLDTRKKRARCLEALHEMRAMAHIVDMHQLTKDPDRVLQPTRDTKSSPKRQLDRHSLARYLDYCSEMLSLIGKVAALYVQGFPDSVAMQGVDDIENLTTSLSRKIWQKIIILEQAPLTGPVADSSTAPSAATPRADDPPVATPTAPPRARP